MSVWDNTSGLNTEKLHAVVNQRGIVGEPMALTEAVRLRTIHGYAVVRVVLPPADLAADEIPELLFANAGGAA